MTSPGVGRLAPALHLAAMAVGLVGTFLPVSRLLLPLRFFEGDPAQVVTVEWSFWEMTTFPPQGSQLDSVAFAVPNAAVAAGGTAVALALFAVGLGGVFAWQARQDGKWLGRTRIVAGVGAGAVVGSVAVALAQAVAMTGALGLPPELEGELGFRVGPGAWVLAGAAVLALVAAATTLRMAPPAQPEIETMDTPPMGLRLPDQIDGATD